VVQRLNGPTLQRLTQFSDGRKINAFAWSRDGRGLAIARSTTTNDIVLSKGYARQVAAKSNASSCRMLHTCGCHAQVAINSLRSRTQMTGRGFELPLRAIVETSSDFVP
jgi:hypothetical protein